MHLSRLTIRIPDWFFSNQTMTLVLLSYSILSIYIIFQILEQLHFNQAATHFLLNRVHNWILQKLLMCTFCIKRVFSVRHHTRLFLLTIYIYAFDPFGCICEASGTLYFVSLKIEQGIPMRRAPLSEIPSLTKCRFVE